MDYPTLGLHYYNNGGEINVTSSANYYTNNNDLVIQTKANPIYEKCKLYIQVIVIPMVCIFGIVGNFLNMVVLTRKGLKSYMDSMERAAYLGLFSLAMSDMMFCVVTLPHGLYPDMHTFYYKKGFWIYYKAYGMHLMNIFTMCSTWLTVLMAVTRYMGICHPLHARRLIEVRWTKIAVIVIFVSSFLFNLPRFWEYEIMEMCIDGKKMYYLDFGYFMKNHKLYWVFQCLWAILGHFIPLLILVLSNICLIKAFRESTRVRRQCLVRCNSSSDPLQNRITPTLIVIVVMFIVLVSPSETIQFFVSVFYESQTSEEYMLARAVMTVMVAVNFSFTFVLYCVINVHFRRVLSVLMYRVTGRKRKKSRPSRSYASGSSKASMRRSAMVDTEI